MRRLAVLTLLYAAGCARSADPLAAREQVERFFAALPGGDCAVLAPMLREPSRCEATVGELNEHAVKLIEVVDVRPDGRDPKAALVRVRLSKDGRVRDEPVLVRVERHGSAWRIQL